MERNVVVSRATKRNRVQKKLDLSLAHIRKVKQPLLPMQLVCKHSSVTSQNTLPLIMTPTDDFRSLSKVSQTTDVIRIDEDEMVDEKYTEDSSCKIGRAHV